MDDRLIIGIGEVLWDMLPSGRQLGGGTANFAFHMSQLGFDSIVVSAVGEDRLGDDIVADMDSRGLRYCLSRVPQPTGTVEVELNDAGIPSYDIRQGVAWDNIPLTEELLALAPRTACVCFGSLAQRSPVSAATIAAFLDAMSSDSLKVFDINLRQSFYSKDVIESSLHRANILKINDEEIVIAAGMLGLEGKDSLEQCRCLRERYGLKYVVLTCGADGSHVLSQDETIHSVSPKVDVVDTVGAGDSYTAAFCASLLHGSTLRDAQEAATAVSAYVCTCPGGMPLLPEECRKKVRNSLHL